MRELDFDWDAPKRGHVYDWPTLLNGKTWELTLEDVNAYSLESWRSSAYAAAKRSGLKVRIRARRGEKILIQAYREGNDSTEVKSDKETS